MVFLAATGAAYSAYLTVPMVGGAVSIFILLVCFVRRLVWHPLARYPGPLLGRCTYLYAAYHAWKGTLAVDMYLCHQKYGPIVRYSPGRLLINTNVAARDISSHGANVIKSKCYSALVHGTPNTLTIRNTKDHARRRKMLSLAFSDERLRSYEHIILGHVETLCSNLGQSSTVDMALQSDYFTFDVMSEVIFGMRYDALRKETYRFVTKALEKSNVRISALVQASSLATWGLDKYLFPTSIKGRNAFLGFLGNLLQSRAKGLSSCSSAGNVFSYLETDKDPDSGAMLTKAEIRAESATLVVAGSDTSSTTLAGTLFYLSGDARVYERVCREVRTAFSDDQVRLGPKLNGCTYLRACIDETMRLSPPVGGALWREVLPGGIDIPQPHGKGQPLRIPAGMDIGTSIYSLHHNKDYFDNVFEYYPERWIVGEGGSTKESVELARSAFYPFSSGPRSCVGKGFAYHELMLTLAHIIHKYDFSRDMTCPLSSATHFELSDHVTSAKSGPWLQFRARKS